MGHYQIVLEAGQIVRGNGNVAERAEAGRDSIYGMVEVLHLGVQVFPAAYYCPAGLIPDAECAPAVYNILYINDTELLARYYMFHYISLYVPMPSLSESCPPRWAE